MADPWASHKQRVEQEALQPKAAQAAPDLTSSRAEHVEDPWDRADPWGGRLPACPETAAELGIEGNAFQQHEPQGHGVSPSEAAAANRDMALQEDPWADGQDPWTASLLDRSSQRASEVASVPSQQAGHSFPTANSEAGKQRLEEAEAKMQPKAFEQSGITDVESFLLRFGLGPPQGFEDLGSTEGAFEPSSSTPSAVTARASFL